MSRIGNTPINLPEKSKVVKLNHQLKISGPKGEIEFMIPAGIKVDFTERTLVVVRESDDKAARALHGYVRSALANNLTGVVRGWTRTLELVGVGFRAAITGNNLVLNIGFSHPVTIEPPTGISFAVAEGKIVISGIDKQVVGAMAAKIRAIKKPEPYKGKGIRYEGEQIRKKAGKAKAVGATGVK